MMRGCAETKGSLKSCCLHHRGRQGDLPVLLLRLPTGGASHQLPRLSARQSCLKLQLRNSSDINPDVQEEVPLEIPGH